MMKILLICAVLIEVVLAFKTAIFPVIRIVAIEVPK